MVTRRPAVVSSYSRSLSGTATKGHPAEIDLLLNDQDLPFMTDDFDEEGQGNPSVDHEIGGDAARFGSGTLMQVQT